MPPINKLVIKKILVNSLSNIGDVILTFPVIDILRRDFPQAELSLVIGPKAKSLFRNNPHIKKIYLFDKHQPFWESLRWVLELKKEAFDLVIDLRNSAVPYFIFPRYRTTWTEEGKGTLHMRDKHLLRLRSIYPYESESTERFALYIPEEDKNYFLKQVQPQIGVGQKYVVIAPGAAHRGKRWTAEGFAFVADSLIQKDGLKIIFVGDEQDRPIAEGIKKLMKSQAINLCGHTSLLQLAEILKHCTLAIVNDSAPMHLASYLNIPIIALFGPSNPKRYGPWSSNCIYFQRNSSCLACDPKSNQPEHTCMEAIKPLEVIRPIEITADGIKFHKQ